MLVCWYVVNYCLLQAYDQPDVYETKDLPEADQNADIIEEVST